MSSGKLKPDWISEAAERIDNEYGISRSATQVQVHNRIAAIIEVYAKPMYDSASELEQLQKAIRLHRDARGDDRCWMDDELLYLALPEGYTPPLRDTAVELKLCEKFILNRKNPATVYESPERRIEELEKALKRMRRTLEKLL